MSKPPIDLSAVNGMNVLVVGAGGFLGTHLVRRLGGLGAHVVGMYRTAIPQISALPSVRWWQGDASDADQVAAVFDAVRPDLVYHLTSDSRSGREIDLIPTSLRNDVIASLNVMTQATRNGVRRLVLVGSFEEPTGSARDAVPATPYAAAKWVQAGYARMFASLYGLPVAVLRLMMTYGPGQRDYKVIPYTIQTLLRGEPARLGAGARLLDWVYVDDVIDAFVRAAIAPGINATSVDIGSGHMVTLRESLSIIGDLIGRPDLLYFDAGETRALERSEAADTAGAAEILGWRAQTPLDEGLRRTIDWYRGSGGTPAKS